MWWKKYCCVTVWCFVYFCWAKRQVEGGGDIGRLRQEKRHNSPLGRFLGWGQTRVGHLTLMWLTFCPFIPPVPSAPGWPCGRKPRLMALCCEGVGNVSAGKYVQGLLALLSPPFLPGRQTDPSPPEGKQSRASASDGAERQKPQREEQTTGYQPGPEQQKVSEWKTVIAVEVCNDERRRTVTDFAALVAVIKSFHLLRPFTSTVSNPINSR